MVETTSLRSARTSTGWLHDSTDSIRVRLPAACERIGVLQSKGEVASAAIWQNGALGIELRSLPAYDD